MRHAQVVEAYVKQADPQRKLVVVSYVGVWTKVRLHGLVGDAQRGACTAGPDMQCSCRSAAQEAAAFSHGPKP